MKKKRVGSPSLEWGPSALRHLRRHDQALRPIFQQVGPFTLRLETNRFAALAWSIISQQISIRAAATIRQRLADAVAPAALAAEAVRALLPAQLQAAGLSKAKARYLHDLADKVGGGLINLKTIHRADDETVIEQLTQVKGIGRWTAEMFLIFSLGRPDVLPVDDFGLRVAVQRLDGLAELPSKDQVRTRGALWKPYCTVATWYLWQSLKGKA